MAYQPLPHDSVAPPPSGILPNSSPDSHAVWAIDVDAGSGQRHGDAVMEGNGSDPPDPDPGPGPDREDITILGATAWSHNNVYEKDRTVYCHVAHFGGGSDQTVYRWRLQKRDDADSNWQNYSWTTYEDHTDEINITCPSGEIRIHCQARDDSVDPVDSVNSFSSVEQVTTPLDPLVVGDPTVTGEAIVGYTLTCSEPSISGGSGDLTINYYWQDADNKYALYMGATQVVSATDLGRSICCTVYVADNKTGENATVTSTNCLGPVSRPALPEFEVYVDGELHDDPSAEVGVAPNGMVVIEARPQAVAHRPLDLTYSWQVRTGTGRLSGDLDAAGIVYLAPDAAPAGALVTCTATSDDANDNGYAAEVTILVSE